MRLIRDWPFKDKRVELTKAEKAVLNRAAEIAEKAASFHVVDSEPWLEWKRLEHSARWDDSN